MPHFLLSFSALIFYSFTKVHGFLITFCLYGPRGHFWMGSFSLVSVMLGGINSFSSKNKNKKKTCLFSSAFLKETKEFFLHFLSLCHYSVVIHSPICKFHHVMFKRQNLLLGAGNSSLPWQKPPSFPFLTRWSLIMENWNDWTWYFNTNSLDPKRKLVLVFRPTQKNMKWDKGYSSTSAFQAPRDPFSV